MRSEVRPPLTVEETGPQFNHCHISDIWNNMSGSGGGFGRIGLSQVGLGWVSGWVRSGWGWVSSPHQDDPLIPKILSLHS